uniref:Transposase n=1 Tax=Strongyloides venezuelensis TaxID=75913 RepID=A0A0K0EWB4_STRVS
MLDNHAYSEEIGLVCIDVKPYAFDGIENMNYEEVGNTRKLRSLYYQNKVSIDTDIINEYIKRSDRLVSSTNVFN